MYNGILSQQNKEKLSYDGYVYVMDKPSADGSCFFFSCFFLFLVVRQVLDGQIKWSMFLWMELFLHLLTLILSYMLLDMNRLANVQNTLIVMKEF
uniref:Uncharacterized protein n=1 Tax=Meloidogyne incognita TaxID=6306 RepID=A0A914N4B7_MELIC